MHIRAAAVFARLTATQAAGRDPDPVAAVCCGMDSGPDSFDDGNDLALLRDKGKSIFYTIHEDAVHAARLFHAVQGMRETDEPRERVMCMWSGTYDSQCFPQPLAQQSLRHGGANRDDMGYGGQGHGGRERLYEGRATIADKKVIIPVIAENRVNTMRAVKAAVTKAAKRPWMVGLRRPHCRS